jgi:hypothetical protein
MGCSSPLNKDQTLEDLSKEWIKEIFIKEQIYKVKIEVRKFSGKVISKELIINPQDEVALLSLAETMDITEKLKDYYKSQF